MNAINGKTIQRAQTRIQALFVFKTVIKDGWSDISGATFDKKYEMTEFEDRYELKTRETSFQFDPVYLLIILKPGVEPDPDRLNFYILA